MITEPAPVEAREFSRSELSRDSKKSTSSTSSASEMTRTANQYSVFTTTVRLTNIAGRRLSP